MPRIVDIIVGIFIALPIVAILNTAVYQPSLNARQKVAESEAELAGKRAELAQLEVTLAKRENEHLREILDKQNKELAEKLGEFRQQLKNSE